MKIRLSFSWLSLLYSLLLAVTFSVGGCQETETGPKSVIQKNLEAYQDEDLADVKSTMHSDSPIYSNTMELARNLFERYDLEYEIENMETVSRSERTAKVRVTQVTRKVSGAAFRDNRATGIHTLKKEDGQWKVWKTERESLEYLDTD